MPVYNGEKYLGEAIESILEQSEKDFEFIIIDDGSIDGSLALIRKYQVADSRIIVIKSEKNRGVIASLNEGILLAKGKYIARMDADDISLPCRLEKQVHFLEKTGNYMCGSWAEAIDSSSKKLYDLTYPPAAKKIKFFTLQHNPFIHPSVVMRREVFVPGLYDKKFKHIEDYELWTRIVYVYPTGNLEEILLRYRVHTSQITHTHRKKMLVGGMRVRFLALFRWMRSFLLSEKTKSFS